MALTDHNDDISQVKLQVGLLERDVHQSISLFERLSHSIEKIQEVNTNLLRMITLHEEKHEQHERFQNTIQQDIKELHSRITTVAREIEEMIERKEQKILDCLAIQYKTASPKTNSDEDPISSLFNLSKQGKMVWAVLAATFFLGYYSAKIQAFFEAILK